MYIHIYVKFIEDLKASKSESHGVGMHVKRSKYLYSVNGNISTCSNSGNQYSISSKG